MFTKIYDFLKNFIKDNYKGLLAILIIYLVFSIELPYSIYAPGGAIDLDERVTIENSYQTDGSFNMAYVSMVKGSLPFLLISYVIPDWDIVKTEDLTIEGEDKEEMLAREKISLQTSIDNAILTAYNYAQQEIEITKTKAVVSYIAPEAQTDLKIGDEITKVNGEKISSFAELKAIIEQLEPKVTVNLEIIRNEKTLNITAKTYDEEGTKIGVSIENIYEYETDPKISITSKASEAGSSGGLMMSLEIYNKLVTTDITKGYKIVGTGTIDAEGNVGEIGGVKYKLIGAVNNEADIFICPKENYKEAQKVAEEKNYDITIISVATFEEALKKLEEL